MKCPHCQETIPSAVCPECGAETLDGGLYCCHCGRRIGKEEAREVDFSERVACSDGNCIGTVNEKGVCGICGKAYAGEAA
jgi:hypothetical protein